MVGPAVIRSHAAVQQIINRMQHYGKRVIINKVSISSKHGQAVLPVTTTHLPDMRGHFPGNPVVPAVIMLEAMFQLAAVLADSRGVELRIDCIREARFRRIITPKNGELQIKVWDDVFGYRGIAEHKNNTVAEALFGE